MMCVCLTAPVHSSGQCSQCGSGGHFGSVQLLTDPGAEGQFNTMFNTVSSVTWCTHHIM